jgi:WD40 repeat protein
LSGSDTSEVCIWDGQSKELLQRLEGHTGKFKCWTHDQSVLYCSSKPTLKEYVCLGWLVDTVIALAVHPFKRMIATGGLERDKTIILWRDEE